MKNAALYWNLVMDGVETYNRFCKKEQERDAQREVVKNLDPQMNDYWNEKNYQEYKVKEIEHDISVIAGELEATYRLADKLFGINYDDVAQEIRKQYDKKYNAPEPKPVEEVTLTDLEKSVLRSMFSDGFGFDDLHDSFVTWGPMEGKRERGAISSLEQKGVIEVAKDGKDIWFSTKNYDKFELLKMSEYPGWEGYWEREGRK